MLYNLVDFCRSILNFVESLALLPLPDILCFTYLFFLSPFNFQKKQLTRLEAVVDKNEMQSVFANWPWWVFENAPVKFIETMFSSFLLEGNKVSYKLFIPMGYFLKRIISTFRVGPSR